MFVISKDLTCRSVAEMSRGPYFVCLAPPSLTRAAGYKSPSSGLLAGIVFDISPLFRSKDIPSVLLYIMGGRSAL